MRKILKILCTIILLTHFTSAMGDNTPVSYNKWLKMPSDTLIKLGGKYAEIDNKPDSALMCFNIVIGGTNQI